MYAIIETGGKQYRVSPGDEIRVERLVGEVGDAVAFDRILAVAGEDGALQAGGDATTTVSATIASQGRGDKIDVLKFKRRKMYRRRSGHRQAYTQVKINSIGDERGPAPLQAADATEQDLEPGIDKDEANLDTDQRPAEEAEN